MWDTRLSYDPNMGSRERSGQPLTSRPSTTPDLVNLDALSPTGNIRPPADQTRSPATAWSSAAGPSGCCTWLRSDTGHWICVCTSLIKRADGNTYRAVDQLVPAQALRKRDH
jgi:hypothetical protein